MMNIDKRTAQQIVDTVRDVCGNNINFISPDGTIVASTNPDRVGTYHEIGHQVAQTGQAIDVRKDDAFYGTQEGVNLPFRFRGEIVAVIGISGNPEEVRKYAYLAQRITSLIFRERELDARSRTTKQQVDYFVRSLVHGTPINHDFYMDFLEQKKIKDEGKFNTVVVRLDARYNPSNLYLIEQDIQTAFDNSGSILSTFEYPHEYILIMEKTALQKNMQQFTKLASSHKSILNIGIGSGHKLIHQNRSYHEADIAVRSFLEDTNLAAFDDLDIEILLGSVEEDIRRQYAEKVLGNLDEKALRCLKQYFGCQCHLKEAASILFIHEKTLSYQLDRVEKLTGYNPRKFRDATVLFLAIKVHDEAP